MRIYFVLTVLLLVLVACARLQQRSAPSPEEATASVPGVPTEQPAPRAGQQSSLPGGPPANAPPTVMSEAVKRLYLAARAAAKAGQDAEAARHLERALRIEPRHPLLWHNLAVVRFNQGRYRQANSLARKSNSLSSHDRALRLRNWRLIAAAQRGLKHPQQAATAEARANRLAY